MASPFLATIDETLDFAYPRLVEGRESRKSVQVAVRDEINSLVLGGGREIENENSPKEDTVPNRLWLVIVLKVEEFNIHRVLIDNESSAYIIYLPAF